MSNILTHTTAQTEAEYEAILAQLLGEIQVLNEQMQHDQADIDRLRAESLSYRTEAQRLKMEGELLDADNKARLSNLGAMLDRLAGTA